jgi:hypothetical protein
MRPSHGGLWIFIKLELLATRSMTRIKRAKGYLRVLIGAIGCQMDSWGSLTAVAATRPGCSVEPLPALVEVLKLDLWCSRCDNERRKIE